MSISEDLQTRLSGLTQGPNPAPRRISNREMELIRETNPMAGRMGSPGQGFYTDDPANIIQLSDGQNTLALRENDPRINKLIEEGYRMVPSPSTNIDVGPTKGAISNREMEMFRDASPSMGTMGGIGEAGQGIKEALQALSQEAETTSDPEEREGLMRMIEKLQAQAMAPMSEMAQQLEQVGGGEDTMIAHLRPGEIILPPEMMEDPEFESMVENKFNQLGINPEEAVAGIGIASLNKFTGREQFGFFKKIGKSLKKVVKKVAPIAAFIPGVGTALGGVLGGIGGSIGGALGMSGTTGLGGLISSGVKGIAGLGIPGVSSIAGGASAGNFGGIMNALSTKSGLLGGGMFGETGSSYFGGPEAGKGLANRFGLGSGTMSQVEAAQAAEKAQTALNAMTPDQIASMDPAQLQQLRQTAQTGGANLLDRFAGSFSGSNSGMGGLGGLAGLAGAGALAAGLGKLAYDEAKDAKGVSLSPVVAMDATGRYNLEAEMARRMGQQAPNPVEFGLLPQGTLPELSGGKPREPQPMMYGGSVMPMAYADGGNVAMEDFERKNGFIDGPGTETSDDIPAMLSDGEFVMTGRAVRGAGSYDMNNNQGILTLTPNGGPDRENGTELMYQLMEAFSGQARPA